MKITDIDFRKMVVFLPESGKVLLDQQRLLLFRQDAMADLRKLLYEHMGDELARSTLAKFGYRSGLGDFESLTKHYVWDTEQDLFGAGPTVHAWEGIVRAEPTALEYDRATGHFHMMGIWRNSYEAEIHRRHFGASLVPVCHTLTGYASGWATAFFGKPILAIETKCVGQGDPHCAFELKPRHVWGREADPWKSSLEATAAALARTLEDRMAIQAAAISELTTPVMEVWDDVLVLPIVGGVDATRSHEIMDTLLHRIVATGARCAIVDITGVRFVDSHTADSLIKVIQAATLLGTQCVLTGLSPAVAQTLVDIGADLGNIRTMKNLKDGLKHCLRITAATQTKN